jgi:hypothetical protein
VRPISCMEGGEARRCRTIASTRAAKSGSERPAGDAAGPGTDGDFFSGRRRSGVAVFRRRESPVRRLGRGMERHHASGWLFLQDD